MTKPLRLRIADALFDYLYKHHLGEFTVEDSNRHWVEQIDTINVDLLDVADAIIADARLTGID